MASKVEQFQPNNFLRASLRRRMQTKGKALTDDSFPILVKLQDVGLGLTQCSVLRRRRPLTFHPLPSSYATPLLVKPALFPCQIKPLLLSNPGSFHCRPHPILMSTPPPFLGLIKYKLILQCAGNNSLGVKNLLISHDCYALPVWTISPCWLTFFTVAANYPLERERWCHAGRKFPAWEKLLQNWLSTVLSKICCTRSMKRLDDVGNRSCHFLPQNCLWLPPPNPLPIEIVFRTSFCSSDMGWVGRE